MANKVDSRDLIGLAGFLALLEGVREVSPAAAWVVGGLIFLGIWFAPYVRKGWR